MRNVLLVSVWMSLVGCGQGENTLERISGPTMGSSYTVQYVRTPQGPVPEQVRREVEAVLEGVDQRFSTYRSDSLIETFNRLPGNSCQTMPADVLDLVRVGEQLSQQSDGAFDLTIEPLLDLWGFGPQSRMEKVPGAKALASARQRVGHGHLRIVGEQLCKDAPVQVDFNSIAAGYAVDLVVERLNALGVTDLLVEATGSSRRWGENLMAVTGKWPWSCPAKIVRLPSKCWRWMALACRPPVTIVIISRRMASAIHIPSMRARANL